MKVGILSQWYEPEPTGGTVTGVLARRLSQRGHDVHVLTGFPNYPRGSIYPGYRQSFGQRDRISDLLTVQRVPLYPSHDRNPAKRIGNYGSFALSGGLLNRGFGSDRDVLWVYNSPATVAELARHLSRRRGVPFLLHIMDVWPDSVLDSGMVSRPRVARVLERGLHYLVGRSYSEAGMIAVTSPGQVDLLESRGVARERLRLVPVWADESIFYPQTVDRALLGPRLQEAERVLMYAGSLGYVQRLDEVIRAVARCQNAGLHLVLVGSGIAETELKRLALELGATNVHFLGRRDPQEMGELGSAADGHLVSLQDTPLLRVTMPSKIQSILAMGKPIVGVCAGDPAAVISKASAGLVAKPGHPRDLQDALEIFAGASRDQLNTWGRAARRSYELEFAEERAVERVEELLGSLCG